MLASAATIATGKDWEPAAFDPYAASEKQSMSSKEMLSIVEILNAEFGGTDVRRRG